MGMFDKFYDSFEKAETGSISDPWIRTMYRKAPGGSTAYGPVQITKGLVDRSEDAGLFKGTSVEKWVDKFQKQGDDFNYHGNEKGRIADFNANFDYGGSGSLTTPKDKANYRKMADLLIKDHWRQVKDTDRPIENLIKLWRWGPKSLDPKSKKYRTVQDDERYFREFIKPYENP
jgi:hypothetical protein